MPTARKICVVTGSRAEFGLMRGLIGALAADPEFDLQLIATGAHMSSRFGETWREIERDGFPIDEKITLPLEDDSPLGTARAMAAALSGLAEAYARLAPDLVMVLGDRFEILAAAEAAMLLRLPVAHLHGGEITEGAMDDAMRHAITKLAHLHFVATDEFARRVIQLGEDPKRVFNVGAIGLDGIDEQEDIGRDVLDKAAGIALNAPLFLVTFHPATLANSDQGDAARAMLAAFDQFPDATILFTGVNADPGNAVIAREISDYVARNPDRAAHVDSLGRTNYIATLGIAAVVIGNSSSGIIEAPALGVPTVNIGARQKGRPRSASIIDCGEQTDEITDAITRATDPAFRDGLTSMRPAYKAGGGVEEIIEILRRTEFTTLARKTFHNLSLGRKCA
jgi:UDP-N-acetylglucosamine 2-epimerase (non-hydrolysing)/GDP/UDP-N,N'-diacetylbacillosamine 2-epimerase (hydrolysing)